MARLQGISKNLNAFLDLIAFSEGVKGVGDDGYNIIVGFSQFPNTMRGYLDHPRTLVTLNNKGLKSTAAGRYQILARYFDSYRKLLKFNDFSPESQDRIAIKMIEEQKALPLIESGDVIQAIAKCSNIWASFPGNGYGQKQNEIGILVKKFVEFGGKLA